MLKLQLNGKHTRNLKENLNSLESILYVHKVKMAIEFNSNTSLL